MRLLIAFCLFCSGILAALAGNVPLTAREVGLMLRSGYSSEAVLRELAIRHFADAFDATAEQQLVRAGANESLIAALRNGSFVATASEISAAREKATAKEKQTVPRTEPVTQTRNPLPPAPAQAGPSAAPASPNAIYQSLQGNLVRLERGELRKLDDEVLVKKKLYLLFFSSNSSELARNFTTSLVAFYRRVAPLHPEFEIIFFSQDPTAFGMDSHMQRADMPWPAVVFEKSGRKIAGRKVMFEVPMLVLVTGDARVLFSSTGTQNADPDKVIADLDKVLASSSADPLAPPPIALSKKTDYFRPQISN